MDNPTPEQVAQFRALVIAAYTAPDTAPADLGAINYATTYARREGN